MFNAPQLAKELIKISKALGKAATAKSVVTLSLATNGTNIVISSENVRISRSLPDSFDRSTTVTYSLSDVVSILEFDKSQFLWDPEFHTLNDLPIFTTSPVLHEVGGVNKTVEVEDIKPLVAKDALPAAAKLLKKSLIRESEYLLWRIGLNQIQFCQIFPTDWGVRYTLEGEFGTSMNAFTSKPQLKLIQSLLSGRFKISDTENGTIFEDASYEIYFSRGDRPLSADMYPPFETESEVS